MARKIVHEKDCFNSQVRANMQRVGYILRWPKFCRNCGGYGNHYSHYDPSPSGVGLSSGYMVDADPCQQCSDRGICPRCADDGFDAETGDHCEECGWTIESEGVPEPWECSCWIWGDVYDPYDHDFVAKSGQSRSILDLTKRDE
jgi:hypothetical protein